jgi:pyruvate,water dikinase
VYFSECLREIERLSLRKVELATGLTLLTERESTEQMSFMELLLEQEPESLVVPVPGRLSAARAESTLELSLGQPEMTGLREALSARFRRVPEGLFGEGQCRWELGVEALSRLAGPRHLHERRALTHLTGVRAVASPDGAEPASSKLALGRTFARELLRQTALAPRAIAHERAVRTAALSLAELDLAVLPDDGLKRSLEDAFRLFEENARIASEALVSSELLVASAEELDPEGTLSIDAGLEGLTWLSALGIWEERLAVVQNDAECVAALAARAQLPDGAGRRALVEAERALGHFRPDLLAPLADDGEAPRAHPSPWLVALAQLAVRRPADVVRRSREARFAADRRVAAAESGRGQLFGVSLAAARSVSRDAVLLRESVRSHGLTVSALFRRVVLDVDRRLRRIEPTLPFGAAFECTLDELVAAVDLRGSSLLARVLWRRAERAGLAKRQSTWWAPVGRGESTDASGVRFRSATALSLGEGRGPLLSWDGLSGLSRFEGGASGAPVLLTSSLTPSLMLALPHVSGLLVRHGTRSDSVAVVARALGVPLLQSSDVPLAPPASRVILRAGSAEASFRLGSTEELA